MQKTTPPCQWIGDLGDLPLLRTQLAIRQKSREPGFWEVMGSFVLVAYAVWQPQEPFHNDY